MKRLPQQTPALDCRASGHRMGPGNRHAEIPAYDEVWVAHGFRAGGRRVSGRLEALRWVTSGEHPSGTDRVAEVVALDAAADYDLIVESPG